MLGPLFVFGLLTACLLWLSVHQIPSRQTLQAVLRPQATPIGIILPRGAHLENIIVSEGELVRPGQTLARLDGVAARATLQSLEHDLIAARYERHCLLHPASEPFLTSVEDWLSTKDPDPELGARVQSAQESCLAILAAQSSERDALETALDILGRRRSLLDAALPAPAFGGTDNQRLATTQTGVQVLLAQNDLEARIGATMAQLAQVDVAAKAQKASALRAVNARISDLLERREYSTKALEKTLITSEVGGIVTRVRNPGAGHVARQPITIIEVSRSENPTFALEVLGDQSARTSLKVGLPVQVRLEWPGFADRVFPGTLVRQSDQGLVQPGQRFDVELTEGGQAQLRAATGAFVGAGTTARASAIVELGTSAALEVTRNSTRRLWQTTYLARAMRPYLFPDTTAQAADAHVTDPRNLLTDHW
ncbi:hypothetical protein [Shimia ponticola]|uniref:hypothetical protein n=1 Tax=Shimia ponticola TaxID=2582893 RepID=UPI00164B674A|nr:hypothetical protein [Shimia ponticola]